MKSSHKSKFARALVVVIALGVLAANGAVANAASKSITCYKGTAVKKVSGANPKCPVGWTTKKPVAKPAVKSTAKPVATTGTKSIPGTFVFSGTYKGKIAVLWSESDVQATSVMGSGTGNIFGLDTLTGSGSSAPTDQCAGINGLGVLSGGGNTLKVSFDSSAKGCAEDGAAPTVINITGNALITGGTGKFVGATGTLKVTGSFAIKSSTAGFSESPALTLTLTGNINTK